jgi:Cu2+-exporting ATPase
VVDIVTGPGSAADEVLGLAAAVEGESEHPLARAIVDAAKERGIVPGKAESFEAVPGHGAVAQVGGREVAVGNARLLEQRRVDPGESLEQAAGLAGEGRTVVHVVVDGRLAALIALADAPRETAAQAVAELRSQGIRTVMLTGDNRATAERVAREIGIEEVLAEVLPKDKAAKVAELQRNGRRVAMVGDGVNDAPALAQADVGVAIGAGTDVAVETADVVLMRSDPLDVSKAITIGRGTVRKMRQNLGWAIGYNSLALPIAAGVFAPLGFTLRPEIAAISMSGSSIIVAVNALMLRRLKIPAAKQAAEE